MQVAKRHCSRPAHFRPVREFDAAARQTVVNDDTRQSRRRTGCGLLRPGIHEWSGIDRVGCRGNAAVNVARGECLRLQRRHAGNVNRAAAKKVIVG